MKLKNNVTRHLLLLTLLCVTKGTGLAQSTGQSYNSASGVSSGPVSGSDQQIQAIDLVGKQGQKKVDLFTGSFGYSIPIHCAPARNGSEPNLALAYSSAEGNGWCGMGWKLEIGSIERYTRDGFPIAYSTATTPAPLTAYDDTKGFMLNLFGKGYKLFSVATNSPVVEYRAEVDTELLRCFLNTNNNNWTVYDKSGNAYYFGETTNSRVANPKSGWSGYSGTFHWALDQIVTVTGDWTTIGYATYTSPYTGLAERTLYPNQITYNGHTNCNGYSANFAGVNTITFQMGVRPNDWGFSFRSGFRTDQTRQLTNILCQVGSQDVWSYALKYGISPATSRSVLTNVILYGYANGSSTATAYLTNSFAYQANPNAVSFGPVIQWGNLSLPAPGLSGYYNPDVTQLSENESGFNYTVADLIDMDGDGLPDRIAYDPATQPNQYIEQKNLGMQSNGNGLFGATNAFGPSSTATSSMTQPQAYTASAANPIPDADDDVAPYAAMNSPYGRLRDINGDGLPDKVEGYWAAINSIGNSPYTPFTNCAVMLNSGQGFYGATNWAVSTGPLSLSDQRSLVYFNVESGGPFVGFFDINGDGRPDRVMATYTNSPATNFLVQFGTGTNFTAPVAFGPYHSQNWGEDVGEVGSAENWAGIETPEAHMIDINGDGLPDRVMYPLTSSGTELTHPTPYYAVEYNDGYSFESTNALTSMPGAFDQWPGVINQTGSATSASGITFYPDAILDLPFGGMFDLNGDGLPDRVVMTMGSLSNTNTSSVSAWYVYLNNGHGFNSTPIEIKNIANQGHPGSTDGYPYWSMQGADYAGNLLTTLIDINGDGLLDRVMSVYSGASGTTTSSNYFLVQLNQGPFPDLLTNVNNGIGGIISVTYSPSTAYDNRVNTTNASSVSHMPYPQQVTATVTESDGVNTPQTTTYGYGGGYYDGVRREFHGFAVVTNTDPTLRSVVTYFHTGGGRNYSALGEYQDTNSTNGLGNFPKSGMAYRVETYGNDGELYHVQINQVDQTSLGNARYFPFTTLTFDCDYPGNGTPNVTATKFLYDTNENVLSKTEFGQVTNFNPASVGAFSFTDVSSSDTRNYNTTYAPISGNSYIADHPATAILANSNGNTIQEADYSYNNNSGTLAAKLTRISASTFATNGYGYNTCGLVSASTNAAGVQTAISYDSTYNTYPATTTVGSFITTTSYDPRSGQLAVATDISGVTVSNSFDAFLRPVETDKIPVGGSSVVWIKKFDYPAVLQAIVSGVAVNYVDEVQNDGVGGFTNRTYVDGFGRTIQKLTEGENGNYRVVSTAYDGRGNAFLTTWSIFGTIAFTKPTTGLTATWTGYDASGRVNTNCAVSGNFNASGAVTSITTLSGDTGSPLGARTWSYVSGTNPWWIIFTDEDGQVRRYGLDAFGRTNQILEVDGTSIYTNTLKYDQADNLTNLVNADGENIWWAYNDDGGLVAMADPYLGQWTYLRDYAGRLRVQTDARGDVVSNSYVNSAGVQDALGRLQVQTVFSTNYSSHTLIPAFTNLYFYDSSTNTGFTVYPGLLSQVIDSQGWEQNSYDTRARAVKTSRYLNINSNTYTTSFTFDDGDNVTSATYPNSGPTITNSYFHGGNINLVSLAGGSGSPYYTINASGYDEFGHSTNFAYGNGVTTTRSYYSKSKRLQTITAASVFTRTYGYTAGDDITNLSGTGLTNAVTVSYYNLHRIKSYSGISGGPNYGYDPAGNITTNSEGGGSRYTYANPRIQAVRTAFGYTNLYDLCGNMLVRHGGFTNSQAMVYDPQNRLLAIAQAGVMSDEFGYAFDGTRLWKRIDQNQTNIQVWIGNIYEEKGGKKLFHVFAGSEQVCTFETNSALYGGSNTNAAGYYYHQDSLTSSSALSGSLGSSGAVEVNVWFPFGRVQTATPQASFQVSRRFTGQVFDAESGLYYYNARYYDPELGRFIQPDDTISDYGNPQSYNRYSYCVNDPLRYTDPTGHDDQDNYTASSGRQELQADDPDAMRVVQSGRQLAGGEVALAKTVISMTPAGTAISAGEVYTGKDGYSSGQLTTGQRVTAGVMVGVPGVLKVAGKFAKAGEAAVAADDAAKTVWGASTASQGFKTFDELKKVIGSAGEGNQWHHIVEQNQFNIDKFGAETIHNVDNVIAISAELNQKLNGFYAKPNAMLGGIAPREWLKDKTLAQNYAFGRWALHEVSKQ
jgi:RHS repeat-associated protein